MPPSLTAVLLAGGQSTRMGQDKAFLPVVWNGTSVNLWEKQLAVLKSLGPEYLIISGPRKQGYPASVEVLADEWKSVGPFGGLATCLSRMQSDLLLVLAIDLPKIQSGFLKKILAQSSIDCGVVPVHKNRFEPLVAVYPRAALEVAVALLHQQDYVLQRFVAKLLENGLMTRCEVASNEQEQLENWNNPGDAGMPSP